MSTLHETQITEFSPEDTIVNQKTPFRWLLSLVLRHPIIMVMAFGFTLISNVLAALIPVIIGNAFEDVRQGTIGFSDVIYFGTLILILGVTAGILQLMSNFSFEYMAQYAERDARQELYISLLGKDVSFYGEKRVGDIMARAANDVKHLNWMLNPGVLLVFRAIVGIIVPLVFIIIFTDIQLLIVPVLFVLTYMYLLKGYSTKLADVSQLQRASFGKMNADLNETLTGISIVRAFSQEDFEQGKFYENVREFREHYVKQLEIEARYLPLLALGIAIALGFLHAILLYNQGAIGFGEIITYMGILALLRLPTFVNIFSLSLIFIGIAGTKRIHGIIAQTTKIDQNKEGYAETINGNIEYRNVHFEYAAGKQVLKDINLKLDVGKTVVLVGNTGSGKSTLTKLIARIYQITSGEITVDGVDVREWNLASLRSQIAFVEQDIFLFSKSVKENILLGKIDATDDEVVRAAKLAQADEFIRELPEGYDTVLGERGSTLSGGQRQRIAIARAIIRDPRILILDDASSAIDSKTENEIQKAIYSVSRGRTTILITHRVAQIRHADKIVLIKDGKIMAVGSHKELMKKEKMYQGIYTRLK